MIQEWQLIALISWICQLFLWRRKCKLEMELRLLKLEYDTQDATFCALFKKQREHETRFVEFQQEFQQEQQQRALLKQQFDRTEQTISECGELLKVIERELSKVEFQE